MSGTTPGPWKVRKEVSVSGIPFLCIYAGNNIHDFDDIAEVYTNVYWEGDTNARLIAATPELLEALKEAVEIFWTLNSWHDRDRFRKLFPSHWIVRSETLIAKAEGS